jgi:hypothetical protein
MTMQLVRIANIILVAVIIPSGHLYCLWYIGAMHLSLEILNRQNIYLQHRYKIYNTIFWAYQLVLIERLFEYRLSEIFDWSINCAEHLGFGIIICLKIYIYTAVFGKQKMLPRWKRGLIAFSVFNIIGIFNEIFQNSLTNRHLFIFIDDSTKDIKMNLLGGLIFLVGVAIRIFFLKKKTSVINLH